MSIVSQRDDIAVVGPILESSSGVANTFYMATGNAATSPINHYFLLYNTSKNRYLALASGVTYAMGLSDLPLPSGYQLHVFQFVSVAGGINIIPYDGFTGNRIQYNKKDAYLGTIGGDTTQAASFQYTNTNSPAIFTISAVNGEQYEEYNLLAGVRYNVYFYDGNAKQYTHVPIAYSSTGTYNGNNENAIGMPTGISSTGTAISTNLNSSNVFYPTSYIVDDTTTVSNPIFHYCSYLLKANIDLPNSYCSNNWPTNRGFTRDYELNLTNGYIFDYTQNNKFCGDSWDPELKDSLGMSRTVLTTYGKSIYGSCIWNSTSTKFIDSPNVPVQPCDLNSISTCDDIDALCTPYCQKCAVCKDCCDTSTVKACTNIADLCSVYSSKPIWIIIIIVILIVACIIFGVLLFIKQRKNKEIKNKLDLQKRNNMNFRSTNSNSNSNTNTSTNSNS